MTAHYDHALADERHAERYSTASQPGQRHERVQRRERVQHHRTADRQPRRAMTPAVTSVRRGLGLLLLEAGLYLMATADRRGAARSGGLYSVDHHASKSA
jgi:hypothetical protein